MSQQQKKASLSPSSSPSSSSSSLQNKKRDIRRAIINLAKARFQERTHWNGNNNNNNKDDGTTVSVNNCLAPISPTPPRIISKILPMLGLNSSSVMLDLGCGDGRWIMMAAKEYNCRGIGVDLDPERLALARVQLLVNDKHHNRNNVSSLVTIYQTDVMDYIHTTNILQEVDVIVIYLFREAMAKLCDIFQQKSIHNITTYPPNAATSIDTNDCLKIVSIGFALPSWIPSWQGQEGGIHFYIYNATRNNNNKIESIQ